MDARGCGWLAFAAALCACGEARDSVGAAVMECTPHEAPVPVAALPFAATGSTRCERDAVAGACGGGGAPDVAYRITLAEPTALHADTVGSGFDTVLAVRGADGQEIACNDDAGGASVLEVLLEPGSYDVIVDGYGGASGDLALALRAGGGGCGNALCEPIESCRSCAADCGDCGPCGDGVCTGGESACTCAADCGSCGCAHAPCDLGAPLVATCDPCVAAVCAADPWCCATRWDDACAQAASACSGGCGPQCGDLRCDAIEDCRACPADCGSCPGCGDATCAPDESCGSCPADCGRCGCGDGQCAADESCFSCPADCGACGGSCAHAPCVEGDPLVAACDGCATAVCEEDEFCCDPAGWWDGYCVARAVQTCAPLCP